MASPLYVAQNGTYEEFLEVYDPEAHDATEMLCAGLINRDPEAREKISNDMLDRGADATVVELRAEHVDAAAEPRPSR